MCDRVVCDRFVHGTVVYDVVVYDRVVCDAKGLWDQSAQLQCDAFRHVTFHGSQWNQ